MAAGSVAGKFATLRCLTWRHEPSSTRCSPGQGPTIESTPPWASGRPRRPRTLLCRHRVTDHRPFPRDGARPPRGRGSVVAASRAPRTGFTSVLVP